MKADLKEKKTALKKVEKEVATLEAKKAKADAKTAEEAKKAEAEAVLKKLLASGMSVDEILEKLNRNKIGRVDKLNSRSSQGIFVNFRKISPKQILGLIRNKKILKIRHLQAILLAIDRILWL